MMYVVQVDHNALRARSDPMPAATALKVAKAWQSHGDRGVQIVESGVDASIQRSWSIRDFIAFTKETTAEKQRGMRIADAMKAEEAAQQAASV
jgi:hypothetical protein